MEGTIYLLWLSNST